MGLSDETKRHNREVLRILDSRARRTRDDKDASGNWTREAIERYGNQYADGSPIACELCGLEDCECLG